MSILITNSTGLVGQAFKNSPFFQNSFFVNGRKHVDLTNPVTVDRLFCLVRPKTVIHNAAIVGGIKANMTQKNNFFVQNIQINTNILEAARNYNVPTVWSFLSTCVYPNKAIYPLEEETIHDGPPPPTNDAYAYSKRMLEFHSEICRTDGYDYKCVIPNNLFGPHDNFDLEDCHVIPAIIHKILLAKQKNETKVELFGSGTTFREFTFIDDVPKILEFLLTHPDKQKIPNNLNIGNTAEFTIGHVANLIAKELDYKGEIIFLGDNTPFAGQRRKPSNNKKLIEAGFNPHNFTSLTEGINKTCSWAKANLPTCWL